MGGYLLALVTSLSVAPATTGLGLAWKSGITAEVVASPKFAIGSGLQSTKVYLETPDIFVWTIVVVFPVYCFGKVIAAFVAERYVMSIKIINLNVSFDDKEVIKDLTLELPDQGVVSIFGPSGSR